MTAAPEAPQPEVAPMLLRLEDAAKVLSISPRTLWGLAQAGAVKSKRIGKSLRFRPDDLKAFAEAD